MSHKVYINKKYEPVVRWCNEEPWLTFTRYQLCLLGPGVICLLALIYLYWSTNNPAPPITSGALQRDTAKINQFTYTEDLSTDKVENAAFEQFMISQSAINDALPQEVSSQWQTITVTKGENLSFIFERLGLSPRTLHQVITSSSDTKMLARLAPGDHIQFQVNAKELLALRYEQNLTTVLEVTKNDGDYRSKIITTDLDRQIKRVMGVIDNSLFLAGLNAGLSDNLIMRFVSIYGWDIDFALNIRNGDQFKVIYEEQFKAGEKVGEGPILVAEFINRGKVYCAVRYTTLDGNTDYYNENGYSMRKAFLRAPVEFSRISSKFDLERKHPMLNRIRAHKGVDYAAAGGTPVKATGDGTIKFVGVNGNYGKSIVIRHRGGVYDTVYAHMSHYAKGMKRGKYVQQGDIIGYVGRTGLATGLHLHYEFRVNGTHRNPLTVKLPKALKIPENRMIHFKLQTTPLLAQLEQIRSTSFAVK